MNVLKSHYEFMSLPESLVVSRARGVTLWSYIKRHIPRLCDCCGAARTEGERDIT